MGPLKVIAYQRTFLLFPTLFCIFW